MNPLLPQGIFVPDCEAREMPDGRLYLYGSWDRVGEGYCSKELHLYSTDDMEQWKDHGCIFRSDEVLYAPDAIHKDGQYYLYLCGPTGYERVATAQSPGGPFSDPVPIHGADGDGIDPTVFVDDDGTAYFFWGQFTLRGAKMNADMRSLDLSTVKTDLLTEWEHGFHEGASIRKRGDIYYMVYTDITRGRATCLAYATARHPLGPYQRRGVIVDNTGCDPKSWNNHGSIACYKGQWYVFYHRSSHKGDAARRVCAEPITFDENGDIREVSMTSHGVSAPLAACERIPARAACRLFQNTYVTTDEGEEVVCFGNEPHWKVEEWAEYRLLRFAKEKTATFCVKGKGTLTLRGEGNLLLGTVAFDAATYTEVTFPVTAPDGTSALWVFANGACTLKYFSFEA